MNGFKNQLILKEYGRNIQKLVEYVCEIDDKEKRTQYAYTLIELMKQINPNLKETSETTQKMWDDLYIMSNFALDVDAPYPMPEKSMLGKKPQRLNYHSHELIFKHYGRNIELLIENAIKMENEEDQESAIVFIGKLMKTYYSSWNKENVDDDIIIKNIKELAQGKLPLNVQKIKEERLFEVFRDRGDSRERDTRDRDVRDSRDKNTRSQNGKFKKGPLNKRRKT